MIGVPFNPDDCAFIANQAFNANQFNDVVPTASNNSTHTILWDFVLEKLYWVDTKTNLIEHEIPSDAACNFSAVVNYTDSTETGPRFTCVPSNGTAPYTYAWSLKSAPTDDYAIVGSAITAIVQLDPVTLNNPALSLATCKVTDAEGCVTSGFSLVYNLTVIP
jgi:hypothetical protein